MNPSISDPQAVVEPGQSSSPVVIVGAGPTGVMLAIELARRGVEVRVLDKRPSRPDETRAIGIQARTLEAFHQVGIVEQFLESGLRADGVLVHTAARRPVHVRLGRLDSPYPFVLTLSQHSTQRILDERLESVGVRIERGAEVVDVQQAVDGAALRVRYAGGQREATISADWVVGCDGANSIVRSSLGLAFEGDDYGQDWLMAEVLIDPPLRRDRLHVFSYIPAPVTMFPLPGGRWRVFLPQVPDRTVEARKPPDLAEIERVVAQRTPARMTLTDPSLLAAFRCYRRVAKVVRSGRVLVAGDAAHVHSPAAGQGMNTGLQDAFNLGWKLASVVQGQAPRTLVDTYEAERVPIAAGVLWLTHVLVGTFTMASPRKRWVRNQVLPPLLAVPAVERRYASRMAQLSHNYRGGPLAPDPPRRGSRAVAPGDRLPNVVGLRLEGRPVSTLDLLGSSKHTLLLLTGAHADPDLVRAAVERLAGWAEIVHTIVIEGTEATGAAGAVTDPELRAHRRYGAQGGQLMLVRPDGYLACRSSLERPSDVERYLRQLTGGVPVPGDEPILHDATPAS